MKKKLLFWLDFLWKFLTFKLIKLHETSGRSLSVWTSVWMITDVKNSLYPASFSYRSSVFFNMFACFIAWVVSRLDANLFVDAVCFMYWEVFIIAMFMVNVRIGKKRLEMYRSWAVNGENFFSHDLHNLQTSVDKLYFFMNIMSFIVQVAIFSDIVISMAILNL